MKPLDRMQGIPRYRSECHLRGLYREESAGDARTLFPVTLKYPVIPSACEGSQSQIIVPSKKQRHSECSESMESPTILGRMELLLYLADFNIPEP